ncbi:unnamed protein product [Protopolystoma xenopodis]|uniref:Uncharacterized protein n=1 Tax=Protopolystoma xenopodis TaxID=117903 RepID=A0A448X555_9PLAT|nr:unnamed protein product [Protopolystoma xenopodis]
MCSTFSLCPPLEATCCAASTYSLPPSESPPESHDTPGLGLSACRAAPKSPSPPPLTPSRWLDRWPLWDKSTVTSLASAYLKVAIGLVCCHPRRAQTGRHRKLYACL